MKGLLKILPLLAIVGLSSSFRIKRQANDCQNRDDFEKYPNPQDCRQFFQCYRGESHIIFCPVGTYYNDVISNCQSQLDTTFCELPIDVSEFEDDEPTDNDLPDLEEPISGDPEILAPASDELLIADDEELEIGAPQGSDDAAPEIVEGEEPASVPEGEDQEENEPEGPGPEGEDQEENESEGPGSEGEDQVDNEPEGPGPEDEGPEGSLEDERPESVIEGEEPQGSGPGDVNPEGNEPEDDLGPEGETPDLEESEEVDVEPEDEGPEDDEMPEVEPEDSVPEENGAIDDLPIPDQPEDTVIDESRPEGIDGPPVLNPDGEAQDGPEIPSDESIDIRALLKQIFPNMK